MQAAPASRESLPTRQSESRDKPGESPAVRERRLSPRLRRWLAVLAAAIVLVGAGAVAAANVLVELYDTAVDIGPITPTAEQIIRPLVACAVGAAVWAVYWLRTTVHDERAPLWNAYVLLAGVLSGVLMVVAGLGTAVFRVLEWILADPAGTAAEHFEVVPAALGVVAVGAAAWAYHRHVINSGVERERTEVERVYDYLLAGAGLVVAAGGLATPHARSPPPRAPWRRNSATCAPCGRGSVPARGHRSLPARTCRPAIGKT